jgi:type I restriction enzyme S subunit
MRLVLRERRESIRPAADLDGWQPITIRFSGEVLPRDRITAFKGAMFAAYPGDLVFSKIDARNGALGIVPDAIPKAVITSEYPVLMPDPARLRPAFLGLLLRAQHFRDELQRQASGTSGRKRVTADGFLSIAVPLPGLSEQDALVAAYQDAIARAAALEQEARTIEEAGLRAFEDALGLGCPAALPDRPMLVARFRDLERWSHEGILSSTAQSAAGSSQWPMLRLGSVGKVTYGIQKCPGNRPGNRPGIHARPYLRVANVQRGLLDLREIKTINVLDGDMAKLRLEAGDVLLCEGNSADLVGRGAIWGGEIEDCVHQNHILRVRLDRSRVLPEFVLAVINSAHGQSYFRSKAKQTTNLASINSREVAGLPLPQAPVQEQRQLLHLLAGNRADATAKRAQAAALRRSAWAAFEAALFQSAPDGVGDA